MPTDNSLNTGKGREFQKQAVEILSRNFGVRFLLDYSIKIGSPPMEHKFDMVSPDLHYVGECKNYSWTETGKTPHAKLRQINEAVFFLSFLPHETVRFVVMRKDVHPTKHISLADYYYRTNRHLLNSVFIIEIDLQSKTVREIGRNVG